MSYYINLQKAIDYIEDNLEGHVELEQIAKCAGYSVPHFYRVFGAIVGCSVKEYVRRRKLSEAVLDVVTTNRSITEIAFKYGYESHEAFARANLLSINEESRMVLMKPEIICKDERMLLGIASKINQSENMKHGLLLKVKSEFLEMINAIEDIVNADVYYAVYDYDPLDIAKEDEEINYMYYYCVEVSKCDHIPEGMARKVIPQAKYAVFTYDTKNNTLNGEKIGQSIYDYIDGTWLPNSGFELAETVD